MINVRDLHVNLGGNSVLWNVNFHIPQNQLVGILGPNGAGKSTFLKVLMKMIQPISGSIDLHNQTLAYIPQRQAIDWDFPITVFELVLMGAYGRLGLGKRISSQEKERANQILCSVGMSQYQNRQISELSGGQQQRVFLARALMQDAEIYLMDEPFVGVDHATEKSIFEVLKSLKKTGKTIILVHHNLTTVLDYFDWIVMLNTTLVASGKSKEVFTQSNLYKCFGNHPLFLEEVAHLSQRKVKGMQSSDDGSSF